MTVNAYLEALAIGEARFRTLTKIHCETNAREEPIFRSGKNEVIFDVIIDNVRHFLHCGGDYAAALPKMANPYRLLTGEMMVFDALGHPSYVDVIIEERPKELYRPHIESRYIDFAACEFVGEPTDTIIRFQLHGKWDYCDSRGIRITKSAFCAADDFYEGRARIKTNTGYGVIDREGRYIMQPCYEQLEWWRMENVISASHNGSWHLYSRMGQPLTKNGYDYIGDCSEDVFTCERGGRWGYLLTDGSQLTPLRFDEAYSFVNDSAIALLNGKSYTVKK